ncbi:hypothetical protein KDA_06020 [Dictyobacter alpinus]|uniref:HTH marR-type domain-containing protein n=1 Tax=Dictyobacter alpinus TaxID=2014873 RepID=A0A402B199_9CHLR|nr:MarR family transcriptional regulator [Dictyobacter alpinus]GCE25118.1 hypothetical protein KDA_06020 [Dictyobacter alpinus]
MTQQTQREQSNTEPTNSLHRSFPFSLSIATLLLTTKREDSILLPNVAISNEHKDKRREAETMTSSSLSTGALLREIARLHVQLQRNCVAYCGGTTTTQCTVLTELGRSGPVTLAELSRRIGFDKSWTSRAVEHLVQDGLVEKIASTHDRRTVQLSLSAAGEKRLADLNNTLNGLAEQTFEHIPTSQHEMVRSSLELLQQALLTLSSEAPTQEGPEEGEVACTCD